jgi:predicted AAA+ superfamily ATPase
MRYFNTSGPNIIEKHYTLMRQNIIEQGIAKVFDERYFTIWAPRQTGKSTYFRLLAQQLEKQNYKVAHINFENYKDATMQSFLDEFVFNLNKFWNIDFEGRTLQGIFTTISKINDQKLVLIIDEVEGVNPAFFGSFLHSMVRE